jgi:hypothetical protein
MRNYRKKNGQAKTPSTKKTPVQSGRAKVSVKDNKASLKSTAIGGMKARGKPAVAAAKTGAVKPAGAKPTAKPAMPADSDGSSTEESDKEDEEIPEPLVAAKRAATPRTVKPAAKPAAKPGAIDTEDGSDEKAEEKAPAPAAKKQKVTKKAAVEIAAAKIAGEPIAGEAGVESTAGSKEAEELEDPTVDRSADSSSTDNRMYAYFQFTHNTVIL